MLDKGQCIMTRIAKLVIFLSIDVLSIYDIVFPLSPGE